LPRAGHTPPLDAPDLDAAVAALRAHGLRASAARRLVLEVLWRTDAPLTAEQVAGELGGRSDVASVYRNLEALEAVGLIRHFHLGHRPGLYVRAGAAVREYLACDACGRVEAVDTAALDPVREQVRRDHGWEARFTHFPISGLCPACAGARLAPVDDGGGDDAHP
jgi:Fur family transcriptional regulator, ferric uptake regulator